MSDSKPPAAEHDFAEPVARLREQLIINWSDFPQDLSDELDALLVEALTRAADAPAETITLMNPVTRPVRKQLAILAGDGDLDSFYHQEWAELSISADGECYLVYRRRDGGDYAVVWSSATSIPNRLLAKLPDALTLAMFGGAAQ